MKTVDEKLHPRIKEIEKMEKELDHVRSFSTEEQKKQMKKFGYAPMNKKQLEMVYGEDGKNSTLHSYMLITFTITLTVTVIKFIFSRYFPLRS